MSIVLHSDKKDVIKPDLASIVQIQPLDSHSSSIYFWCDQTGSCTLNQHGIPHVFCLFCALVCFKLGVYNGHDVCCNLLFGFNLIIKNWITCQTYPSCCQVTSFKTGICFPYFLQGKYRIFQLF